MKRIPACRFTLLFVSLAVAGWSQPAAAPLAPTGAATPPTETSANDPLRIEVSFPATVRDTPATGRVLLFLTRETTGEPRRNSFTKLNPVYGLDIRDVKPGETVEFTPAKFMVPTALAFPSALAQLPPGTYRAQVVFDLDTTARDFNTGPGNLYSQPQPVELNGTRGGKFTLVADKIVKTKPPEDTEWVKLVDIESARLTEFHHRSTHLRASVILPSTYQTEPTRKYPVVYIIPGFGGRHTAAFNWINSPDGKRWQKGDVPLQSLHVILDPEVPLGHSVFANSANNGPVGDALVHELIPEIERRFRALAAPDARYVTGHSSGGWSSLWLQVAYPDFFGGCWSTSPDPVDFRAFQTVNLYADKNGSWTPSGQPRALSRSRVAVEVTFPELQLWEYVTGYGSQLDSFDAVFSPRGADGRPRPVMDKLSGTIDRAVVDYWKRYDIRLVLETNWKTLGPKLHGKLHVLTGSWDTYYLNPAVELLADFLKTTDFGGYVELLPGDHGSVMTPAVRGRIETEMAAAFAASHPSR